METLQSSRAQWLTFLLIVLDVFIALIILGTLMWEQPIYAIFGDTIGTMVEGAVIPAGLYFAAPLVVFDIIIGSAVLLKRHSKKEKTVAITSIVIGALGILTSLFWWALLLLFG